MAGEGPLRPVPEGDQPAERLLADLYAAVGPLLAQSAGLPQPAAV